MGEKCNALAREILQKLADVSREMIDKKVLGSNDSDLLLKYRDRFEEIGKLTNRPECK